ncbi:nucleotide exchange factor GrpE [Candidatus Uhrbacteria bacterium]|nr:nucleotide exchange factor GrpE [Candidatus Uhrbacteria bacterium]
MDDLTIEPCAKCDEYLSGWKRAQADYQNLKKDTEREKSEYAKYANERLLSDLLPALDQFALALQHIPSEDADQKSWNNWLTGIKAVQSLWEQAAKAQGLERIDASGVFDPQKHEAVGSEEAEGKESGSIIRVMQEGWSLNGKIIRPAKVIIAK